MANDPFDTPTNDFVKVSDFVGELVLFSPTEYKVGVKTSRGESDAVVTDIVVLTKDNEAHSDVMVFQRALGSVLKRRAKSGEGMVLGRVGKGEAKKGQSAPYILEVPTDQDKQAARDYLAGLKDEDPFAV